MRTEYVVYQQDTMQAWDIYDDETKATEAMPDGRFKVASMDDFLDAVRQEQLRTSEATAVTEQDYTRALEVLPPRAWTVHNGMEVFCMGEPFSGAFFHQYAMLEDEGKRIYASRLVDLTDKRTWIRADEVRAVNT